MPIKMVSPRDYRLPTRLGHTIFYPANVPVSTPDEVVHEAMARNILPVTSFNDDEKAKGIVKHDKKPLPAPLKEAVILQTIDSMVKENDSSSFNAGGQPKLSVLNSTTGIRITGGELTKYWDRYREITSSNSPLPSHPRVEHVMELQRLTTRKQLLEYASEIGVPADEVSRRSVKEAKEILMSATITFVEPATPLDTSSLSEP